MSAPMAVVGVTGVPPSGVQFTKVLPPLLLPELDPELDVPPSLVDPDPELDPEPALDPDPDPEPDPELDPEPDPELDPDEDADPLLVLPDVEPEVDPDEDAPASFPAADPDDTFWFMPPSSNDGLLVLLHAAAAAMPKAVARRVRGTLQILSRIVVVCSGVSGSGWSVARRFVWTFPGARRGSLKCRGSWPGLEIVRLVS